MYANQCHRKRGRSVMYILVVSNGYVVLQMQEQIEGYETRLYQASQERGDLHREVEDLRTVQKNTALWEERILEIVRQ